MIVAINSCCTTPIQVPAMANETKPYNPTKRIIINVCCIVGLVLSLVAMNVAGLSGALPGALFGALGGGLGGLVGYLIAELAVRDA